MSIYIYFNKTVIHLLWIWIIGNFNMDKRALTVIHYSGFDLDAHILGAQNIYFYTNSSIFSTKRFQFEKFYQKSILFSFKNIFDLLEKRAFNTFSKLKFSIQISHKKPPLFFNFVKKCWKSLFNNLSNTLNVFDKFYSTTHIGVLFLMPKTLDKTAFTFS